MTDKKTLPTGDKAAVLLSANTTCYNPDCSEPLIVFRDSTAIVNFEYAHIRDELKPKDSDADIGWRYFPDDLTQEQRNHHSNIILLCSPCHKLVDKIRPRDFSVESLHYWKSSAESGSQPLPAVLGGLDLDLLQSLVSSTTPPERSFPFIDYRIVCENPNDRPPNPVVTPFLQICGSTKLISNHYHISISQKTINIFNPELSKSSSELKLSPGTHYQLHGFPLAKCWENNTTPFLSIHAVVVTDSGTFTQETSISVTEGLPTIKTHHSHVSFADGSHSTSTLIYTRTHDTIGNPINETIHADGWATNAHRPLYSQRL